MRVEKQYITKEYVKRLNASPFFLVVDYQGLKVGPITELRKRLNKTGAQMHVVKNSLFRVAAREAGIADLTGSLNGMLAVVTGQKDLSSAAKVIKTFAAEFEKPKIKFGYLSNKRVELQEILSLADLPPIEVLRGKFMGLLNTPATRLVQLLNTPATQLARVLKAKAEKG